MPLTYARHLRRQGVTIPVVLRLILVGIVTSVIAGLVQLLMTKYLGA